MYAERPLRRPTFDAFKAVVPIRAFFIRIYAAFTKARRPQSLLQTAQYLKSVNPDFRDMSLGDILHQLGYYK
jgi:hypothetical protein